MATAQVKQHDYHLVDPKYATDINTKNATDITLSYTFFPAQDVKPQG